MTLNNSRLDRLDEIFENDGYCISIPFSKQYEYLNYVLSDITNLIGIVSQDKTLSVNGETVVFRNASTSKTFKIPTNYVDRDDAETLKTIYSNYRAQYKRDYDAKQKALENGKRFKTQFVLLTIFTIFLALIEIFGVKNEILEKLLALSFFCGPFVVGLLLKLFKNKIKCNLVSKAIIIIIGLIPTCLMLPTIFHPSSIFTAIFAILLCMLYTLPFYFFAMSLSSSDRYLYEYPSEDEFNISIDDMMQKQLKDKLLNDLAFTEICSGKYKDVIFKNPFPTYDNSKNKAEYLVYSDISANFSYPSLKEMKSKTFHFSTPAFDADCDENILKQGKYSNGNYEYFNLQVIVSVAYELLIIGFTYHDIIDIYMKNYDRISNVNDINRLLEEKYMQENRDYREMIYQSSMMESQKKIENNSRITAHNSEMAKEYQKQQLQNQEQQFMVQNWYNQQILASARSTESAAWFCAWNS